MQEGDGGFADFVRAQTPALLRSAYLLTGDQQLAEDLVQEALARTSLHWARIVSGGDPEPDVRTVMHRLRVSWWCRRRFFTEEPAEEVPEPWTAR